jgi:hypothetical protein
MWRSSEFRGEEGGDGRTAEFRCRREHGSATVERGVAGDRPPFHLTGE